MLEYSTTYDDTTGGNRNMIRQTDTEKTMDEVRKKKE